MICTILKNIFCGLCNHDTTSYHKHSRSHLILMVSLYNLDYVITDKDSGELVDCDVTDYNEYYHNIKVKNNMKYDDLYL